MLGVGGIGSGTFFALSGNHTLGREESRGGHFLDRHDYCKLHIIAHYVQALLGPDFRVIPIGRVGDDPVGRQLLDEMRQVGLEMDYVKCLPGDQTLFSFCFVYPDGSGGNLTTDDSASGKVDPALVAQAEPEFARFAGRGIALAAPEVPLPARQKLLQLGSQYGFFRVASFVTEEIGPAMRMGLLHHVDLLALNLNEAAAIVSADQEEDEGRMTGNEGPGTGDEGDSSRHSSLVTRHSSLVFRPAERSASLLVASAVERLQAINPAMLVSITAGKQGSWFWDGASLVHLPAFEVEVVSTAGAGDAHLAGILAGLVAGLRLSQAQELGTLTAALSVTSPHTINKEIDRKSLQAFAAQIQPPLSEYLGKLVDW
jgi:ribokinase